MNSASYTFAELADMLRDHAHGVYTTEAAVELLIKHQIWPMRLRQAGLVTVDVIRTYDDGSREAFAFIDDWPTAIVALDTGRLPCSTSEAQILRIAASIAGGVPVDLRDALGGLDETNLRLVLQAIAHANGHQWAEVDLR